MKKTTIRPPATPHSSFRLSRPDRVIVEKRFTLPVSRPVMLMKSEPWGRNTARSRGQSLLGPQGCPAGTGQRAGLTETCMQVADLTMPSRYRFWSSVSLSMSRASWSGHRGRGVRPGHTHCTGPDPPRDQHTLPPPGVRSSVTWASHSWEAHETLPGLHPLGPRSRVPAGATVAHY